jgi:hypothetical protein
MSAEARSSARDCEAIQCSIAWAAEASRPLRTQRCAGGLSRSVEPGS